MGCDLEPYDYDTRVVRTQQVIQAPPQYINTPNGVMMVQQSPVVLQQNLLVDDPYYRGRYYRRSRYYEPLLIGAGIGLASEMLLGPHFGHRLGGHHIGLGHGPHHHGLFGGGPHF